jgi:hypothetical protein
MGGASGNAGVDSDRTRLDDSGCLLGALCDCALVVEWYERGVAIVWNGAWAWRWWMVCICLDGPDRGKCVDAHVKRGRRKRGISVTGLGFAIFVSRKKILIY